MPATKESRKSRKKDGCNKNLGTCCESRQMIHRNIKLRPCLVCKTITTCEKRQATRAPNLPINLWSYFELLFRKKHDLQSFYGAVQLPPSPSTAVEPSRSKKTRPALVRTLLRPRSQPATHAHTHTRTPLPTKGMHKCRHTPLHEKIETCMLWPCALLHEEPLYTRTQTHTITHAAVLRAIICHPGDEFTVVLSLLLQAPTSGIPLEIYVRAAVVSSACVRTLKTTPSRELRGGSNPLHTSSQLLEGFWMCVCVCSVHHFLCLWAAVKVVNADCFAASTMCLQLHDFLSVSL